MKLTKTLFLIAFLNFNAALAQTPKTPNIILILSDDQGWGGTSVKMDPADPRSASDFMRTPNLEKLAASGIRFTNGYTCHPNCSPSRASLQTGKTPARLHLTDIIERSGGDDAPRFKLIAPPNLNALPATETTIAEMIKKYRPEYATAYFGKWHQGGDGPRAHGYDVSDGPTGNQNGSKTAPGDPKAIFSVTKRSCDWIEDQAKAKKPFFIQVAHYAVHAPTQANDSTKEKYESIKPGSRHNNVNYAAMTDDLDKGLGILLEKVRSLGLEENTYIIYLSDNGALPDLNPGNTNGPLRGTKATVWEGGIRTPFVVSGPGIAAGKVSSVPVVGWDLFPTICDWLSIKNLPKDLDGGSIAQVLKNGGTGTVRRPYDFMVFHWPNYVAGKESFPSTSIIQGNFKLFVSYETNEKFLYDLNTDREEQHPANSKYPEKVKELDQKLTAYLKSINAGMPEPNPNYSAAAAEKVKKNAKKH